MSKSSRFQALIDQAIASLNFHQASLNGEVFRLLFLLSFDDLKLAEVGNPLVHHIIVLKHMIEIAQEEELDILVGGAIAVLHDIAPVEKIRKADVAAEKDGEDEALLELRRRQHRILHMREGSAIAHRKLLLFNEFLGKDIYREEHINNVCEVIRIHDNPSINIPIPATDHMAMAFREADRLWMLSEEGFAYDILRDRRKITGQMDTITLASKRLEHVLIRYQEERNLYLQDGDSFQDPNYFFRTESGYRMFHRYLKERRKQYGIE